MSCLEPWAVATGRDAVCICSTRSILPRNFQRPTLGRRTPERFRSSLRTHAGLVASVTHSLRLQRASVCLIRRHLLRDVGGIPGEEFSWDDTNAMQCSSSDAAVGRRPRAVRFGRPCKMVGMGHLKSWLKSHNKLGGFHLTCVEMGLPSITPIPF